jgi:two-component system sensor histidine kinase DesK
VITVKAELAQRLLDVDPARAKAEVADLERLSRDALFDVRRAVEGYRELTLPGELARARTALAAAEIDADLPNSTEEVPSDRRELFAWTGARGRHQRDPAQRRPALHRAAHPRRRRGAR